MLSATIAQQLRSRGHDVVAVVEDPSLMALPDEEILATAAAPGRGFVTANIKAFTPLTRSPPGNGRWRCWLHEGLASAEIARRLVLSTRTVENHLQRVNDKLGVASRSELRPLLQPEAGHS